MSVGPLARHDDIGDGVNAPHVHPAGEPPHNLIARDKAARSLRENAEALVPHRTQEHMKTFGRVAVKCFAAPPKIEIITPADVVVR